MLRTTTLFGLLAACVALTGATGCNDELKAKNEHIALIEDTNQRLNEDLAAAKRAADALAQQRDDLNSRLANCQGQVNELTSRLGNQPEAPVASGWQAVPGGAMIAIEGNVLFPAGKSTLRPEAKGTLDAITSTIRSQYSDKDIFVFGHTDDSPIVKSGWKDNFELSSQRALTVVRHLKEQGVAPVKLVACGAGEHRPRVANSNNDNRSKNRRVEIFAVNPQMH